MHSHPVSQTAWEKPGTAARSCSSINNTTVAAPLCVSCLCLQERWINSRLVFACDACVTSAWPAAVAARGSRRQAEILPLPLQRRRTAAVRGESPGQEVKRGGGVSLLIFADEMEGNSDSHVPAESWKFLLSRRSGTLTEEEEEEEVKLFLFVLSLYSWRLFFQPVIPTLAPSCGLTCSTAALMHITVMPHKRLFALKAKSQSLVF